ncbi:ORF70 [Silurid herpesvirus 1]|nr:ORF70 [Silurid herpesvirus 1]
MEGYFKNIICDHQILCNDIRAALIEGNIDREYRDYVLKSTMITFYAYYQHYMAIDPLTNIDILNQALGCCPAKLFLLTRLPRDDTMYEYLQQTLGIPSSVSTKWIMEWDDKTVYAAVCATELCLTHISPLHRIIGENPDLFFEFYCVYNRAWKMDRVGEHMEKCCRGGRVIYNIMLQCTQHSGSEGMFGTLPGIINFVRSTMDVPPRQLSGDMPSIDMSLLFKNFCV